MAPEAEKTEKAPVRMSLALQQYRLGKGPSLDIDPRIDLTKPIFEQAIKLADLDKKRNRRKQPVVA